MDLIHDALCPKVRQSLILFWKHIREHEWQTEAGIDGTKRQQNVQDESIYSLK